MRMFLPCLLCECVCSVCVVNVCACACKASKHHQHSLISAFVILAEKPMPFSFPFPFPIPIPQSDSHFETADTRPLWEPQMQSEAVKAKRVARRFSSGCNRKPKTESPRQQQQQQEHEQQLLLLRCSVWVTCGRGVITITNVLWQLALDVRIKSSLNQTQSVYDKGKPQVVCICLEIEITWRINNMLSSSFVCSSDLQLNNQLVIPATTSTA